METNSLEQRLYTLEKELKMLKGEMEFKEASNETVLVTGENDNFIWGWKYVGIFKGNEAFTSDFDAPGKGPAVGLVSEWHVESSGPMMGDAWNRFILHNTGRTDGTVRVTGYHTYGDTALNCAVGFIAVKEEELN